MSMDQLNVPSKLRVGFKDRKDCYTGKIGYVIYYDKSGKICKERSFDGWREHKYTPVEFDNTPTSGFVFNKAAGGHAGSYSSYHVRKEKVRVYDPRDFEIEISIQNLLFILANCDCSKGKGLEGKCVYAWNGASLVLMPVDSAEYKNCLEYMDLKTMRVKTKDLILGATYLTKKQKTLTYVGRLQAYFHNEYYWEYRNSRRKMYENGLRYVFWDGQQFVLMLELKELAKLISSDVSPDYAYLVDNYHKSIHGSPAKRLFLEPFEVPKNLQHMSQYWAREMDGKPGSFISWNTYMTCSLYNTITRSYEKNIVNYHQAQALFYIKDGAIKQEQYDGLVHNPKANQSRNNYFDDKGYFEPDYKKLRVELESGAIYDVGRHRLSPIEENVTNTGEENGCEEDCIECG